MVFQDPMTSLNPVMSVGDQIAETIKIHNPHLSKEEVEQRVENTLQMVGTIDRYGTWWQGTISGVYRIAKA